MTGALCIDVAGEAVHLLPERALFWPTEGLLVVADLHWGKVETFLRYGVPVPGGVLEDDLARLAKALEQTGAQRLVVLGDLVHGQVGLTEGLEARVGAWRAAHPVALVLVLGNHDRRTAGLPARWGIEVVEGLEVGPFAFRHEPEPVVGHHVWCGHIHPTVVLGPGTRLPCFHIRAGLGILPAFSAFSGGPPVRRASGERCFGVTPSRVVAVWGRDE